MQVRHRIPTIFSIYMVDVLCCALGCVVLLWQLYHYESEEQSARARESLASEHAANDKLTRAQLAISSLHSEVEGLKVALDAARKEKVQLTLELDDTRGERDKANKLVIVEKQKYDQLLKERLSVEAA